MVMQNFMKLCVWAILNSGGTAPLKELLESLILVIN